MQYITNFDHKQPVKEMEATSTFWNKTIYTQLFKYLLFGGDQLIIQDDEDKLQFAVYKLYLTAEEYSIIMSTYKTMAF